jgi:hypothetical protein
MKSMLAYVMYPKVVVMMKEETKLTLLSLVEDWRTGMIVAFFLRVRIDLAA